MEDEPTDDGVERGIGERSGKGIPTHVGDVLPEAAAGCEAGRRRVQLALQFQRRNVAADRAGQVARRTTKTSTDIKHVTRRTQAEQMRGPVHRVRAVVVVLVVRRTIARA